MCNSDPNLEVKFELKNFRMHGAHPSYGFFTVTLQKLLASPNQQFELRNPGGAVVGTLAF